ncbi:MAG: hypothetical protein H0X51_00660 [Parachlamydiaceae bacterium]|nr:hypothetical protein [Parachlamydiaceae bacterium]
MSAVQSAAIPTDQSGRVVRTVYRNDPIAPSEVTFTVGAFSAPPAVPQVFSQSITASVVYLDQIVQELQNVETQRKQHEGGNEARRTKINRWLIGTAVTTYFVGLLIFAEVIPIPKGWNGFFLPIGTICIFAYCCNRKHELWVSDVLSQQAVFDVTFAAKAENQVATMWNFLPGEDKTNQQYIAFLKRVLTDGHLYASWKNFQYINIERLKELFTTLQPKRLQGESV